MNRRGEPPQSSVIPERQVDAVVLWGIPPEPQRSQLGVVLLEYAPLSQHAERARSQFHGGRHQHLPEDVLRLQEFEVGLRLLRLRTGFGEHASSGGRRCSFMSK